MLNLLGYNDLLSKLKWILNLFNSTIKTLKLEDYAQKGTCH